MRLSKRPREGKIKGVYIFPNVLTSLSLFAGFFAIVSVFEEQFVRGAWAIIVALLFDNLDGRMARVARASSRFGLEYDSLTDLVSFGVAPAVLVYVWALKPFGKLGWLAAFIYLASAALRLARYNVQVEKVESKRFNGLPSPAAACVVATTVLFYHYLGISEVERSIPLLTLIFLLAFLMVSSVKYHSFKELHLFQQRPVSTLFILVLLLVLVAAEPILMLFSLFYMYMFSGIGELIFKLFRRAAPKKLEKAESPGHYEPSGK